MVQFLRVYEGGEPTVVQSVPDAFLAHNDEWMRLEVSALAPYSFVVNISRAADGQELWSGTFEDPLKTFDGGRVGIYGFGEIFFPKLDNFKAS